METKTLHGKNFAAQEKPEPLPHWRPEGVFIVPAVASLISCPYILHYMHYIYTTLSIYTTLLAIPGRGMPVNPCGELLGVIASHLLSLGLLSVVQNLVAKEVPDYVLTVFSVYYYKSPSLQSVSQKCAALKVSCKFGSVLSAKYHLMGASNCR